MRKGTFVFLMGAGLTALLLLHHLIPTTRGLALMVESVLPWTGVLVVFLLVLGLIRFSVWSVIGVVIPALVWGSMFGTYLKPASEPDHTDIVVATQNVGARLPEPSATALNIIERKPDIVTLQEIESLSGKIIREQMDKNFKHHKVSDTVGLWSKWPISDTEEIDLGLSWPRAFAATVATDHGDVRVYSVHMPSVRPGSESLRNAALQTVAQKVSEDPAQRVIVAGDFNSTSTDRYFADLNDSLTDTRRATGGGFGFTWPAKFPVARLDHIMVRGMEPVSDTVLPRGTSDHRAIVAGINLNE
ncbi:endonuclease/exonuclease/phosphatase family protein [Brevibacterium sp. UMB1308A]|uniref:endonuclease/exonuclease/phosphatase family protein n=1 Tax=Brevibacterium sp. UMB1308A TaxID=3050608 RepID=UPI00254D49D4|nr:endonuclease/exonuclease/phosphatase family protein [Brevibacterium sp. UMB1308A]MDK8347609.1 endonuclease/exonuclease/phosphatase family protein [Brevibacterium sp. UMB1308B]MDK8714150.1 endonuclease/exonuclease/phosphatase family protein [Brevibacterium sp. UMB1308A]